MGGGQDPSAEPFQGMREECGHDEQLEGTSRVIGMGVWLLMGFASPAAADRRGTLQVYQIVEASAYPSHLPLRRRGR